MTEKVRPVLRPGPSVADATGQACTSCGKAFADGEPALCTPPSCPDPRYPVWTCAACYARPPMECLFCGLLGPGGNHCEYCLWSVHMVDNDSWPAFALSDCLGLMRPARVRENTVVHRCTRCGQRSRARLR